ncbi:uncharacterized protein K444DRAFT_374089 [Hyaloscypha bicolor E]|uniref:Uncharacterized protein n=1 Tax=Hyaloscypha bicolor E TaxID=1095630 RepID=A0A2J6TEY5_9HELO|nr:uncharacterized protein K444DRAFT_374089 [Hyaloscypha bicolor E]PMD61587.1 hypothetical protein K444DRAFT_374089 [Hyaloscypha bicolor E]
MVTTHHCPGKSQGNCRGPAKTPRSKKTYCTQHQTYCPREGCDERRHLKTESCIKCDARQAAEERKRKEEEKKQKAKEEQERKKPQQAQGERDRKEKNKKK